MFAEDGGRKGTAEGEQRIETGRAHEVIEVYEKDQERRPWNADGRNFQRNGRRKMR
jgi:hypothetical protein